MYLVPSYVGTQIWGTASHHVLLLSSRKSCLMTSRGKLVHWWGSWEGAGGPGRAAAARRRSRRPPVRRPPAPPAGGAGDGGGTAGSARGDGPRRRRGKPRSGAVRCGARLRRARCRQRYRERAARRRRQQGLLPHPDSPRVLCTEPFALCLFFFSLIVLLTPVHKSYTIYLWMLAIFMSFYICIYFPATPTSFSRAGDFESLTGTADVK